MYSLNRKKGNPFEQKGNILSRINGTYARIVFLFNLLKLPLESVSGVKCDQNCLFRKVDLLT